MGLERPRRFLDLILGGKSIAEAQEEVQMEDDEIDQMIEIMSACMDHEAFNASNYDQCVLHRLRVMEEHMTLQMESMRNVFHKMCDAVVSLGCALDRHIEDKHQKPNLGVVVPFPRPSNAS